MNYLEIDKYFGTPLSYVTKPTVPFKWKKVHTALTITGLAIFVYTVVSLKKDFEDKFSIFKEQKK
jgi:hypothetical protein